MTDYASLAIGSISGLIAFVAVVARMRWKEDVAKRRRPKQENLPFSPPRRVDASVEGELVGQR